MLNRVTWHTSIWSQAKLKLPFPQYPFLTLFLTKKEYYGNEDLSLNAVLLSAALLNAIPLSNLVYFYMIFEHSHVVSKTFTWSHAKLKPSFL